VAVFQPAEEVGRGAQAMLDDGVLDRFPRPGVVLGQHVGPLPAGVVITRPGTVMAAADSIDITLHGAGAHASAPHLATDPVVMAAAVIMRLQTLSARMAPLSPSPVLAVGAIRAGTVPNVIPHVAELRCSLRTFDEQTREQALTDLGRIVRAEADAQGATRAPDVRTYDSFPSTVNDADATARVLAALDDEGVLTRVLPAPLAASEDFGRFAAAAGCPSVMFHFGGAAPEDFGAEAVAALERGTLPPGTVMNHSPRYAPSDRHAVASGARHLLTVAGPAGRQLGVGLVDHGVQRRRQLCRHRLGKPVEDGFVPGVDADEQASVGPVTRMSPADHQVVIQGMPLPVRDARDHHRVVARAGCERLRVHRSLPPEVPRSQALLATPNVSRRTVTG
jgi:metal-dependent amidase/aminoacylase/carboxypeptidase family protein